VIVGLKGQGWRRGEKAEKLWKVFVCHEDETSICHGDWGHKRVIVNAGDKVWTETTLDGNRINKKYNVFYLYTSLLYLQDQNTSRDFVSLTPVYYLFL
jgi:hypothetical protein